MNAGKVKSSVDLTPAGVKQELNAFRGKCSMLFHYDMISVPLVYTQVEAPSMKVMA